MLWSDDRQTVCAQKQRKRQNLTFEKKKSSVRVCVHVLCKENEVLSLRDDTDAVRNWEDFVLFSSSVRSTSSSP